MWRRQSNFTKAGYIELFLNKRHSSNISAVNVREAAHFCDVLEGSPHILISFCSFCHLDFKNLYHWQAHFITFIHKTPFPPPKELKETHEEALIVCKFCSQDVVVTLHKDHRCYINEITRLETVTKQYNETYVPIVCILCKKIKTFSSQAILQIHLLTQHSATRDPLRCNFCNAKFKTKSINLHESHVLDVHGPELNLIYWKLSGERVNIKGKPETIKYACAISHFSALKNDKITCCPGNLLDVFELTLHTLCYHGILPNRRNIVKKINSVLSSEFTNDKICFCMYCAEMFPSSHSLTDHISSKHLQDILIRKDFVLRKGLLVKKIPLNTTCIICLTLFKSQVDLQVHLMVNHGTNEFGLCGLCGEDLFHFKSVENHEKIDRIHWKTIKYHEGLHLKQFLQYKETGIFNKTLKLSPKIYVSEQQFADEIEAKKNVKPGPLFTEEQIAFFRLLGQRNYETQVNMEINDH